MRHLYDTLAAFGAAQDGAVAVQYGLIVALAVIVVMGAIISVGGAVDQLYQYVGDEASTAMDGARAAR